MTLTAEELAFFDGCTQPLLHTEPVGRMDDFVQHGSTSCLCHCMAVAYYSYVLCRRLRLRCDEAALVRGALLHDFFLYDWHIPNKTRRWHGFTHPKAALENARRHFSISDTEQEIILCHMWPLTWRLPRRREAALVCMVDKLCTVAEMVNARLGRRFFTRFCAPAPGTNS